MRRRCPKCGGTIWRFGNGEHPYYCNNCKARFTESEVTVPPTNADSIRTMTDAELANWLNDHNFNCPPVECPGEDCVGCWLKWLGQEAGK